MEEDPRPLDAVDGDAPESLARALRALGRQRPSDAVLQAAASRLEASVTAPRGALETAKSWGGSSTKLLGGKLIAAALVLGGATLALRSASPVTPKATPAMSAARLTPSASTAHDEARPVDALARAHERTAQLGARPPAHEHGAETRPLHAADQAPAPAEAASSPKSGRTTQPSVARSVQTSVARAGQRHAARVQSPLSEAPPASTATATPEQQTPAKLASPPAKLVAEAAEGASRPAAVAQERPLGAESPPPLVQQAARAAPPTEVELLLDAKRRAGSDPAGTLRVVAEHARRFPDGALAPEREVLAIEALRALGKTAEAEQRLHIFQARYPGSIHVRALSSPAH